MLSSSFGDKMNPHQHFPLMQYPDRQILQIPTGYHPQQQQQQQQQSIPQMMQHPQGQIHHLMQSTNPVSTPNHHRHHQVQAAAHPPKEMNKPKGRMSAYTFFVQKCRDEHRKAYPNENANFSEFSKKCSEKWKTMTESEKSRFAAQAEVDKQRFEREMAVYQPGEKRKKKKKDPLAPKRPLSAFFHYCKEERPKLKAMNPSLSVGEIAKELGDRWNHTAPEGKQTYEEAAQRDKERYEKEMNDFRSANKKPTKSNSSPQVVPPAPTQPAPVQQQQQQAQQQQIHSDQQVRIHQDQQQQQQQQQYSSAPYQLPSFTPMQSFPAQSFAQMNNFQDSGLGNSMFSHYNSYSLQMPHNNMPMQQFQSTQHLQHQTYQTLTSANPNSTGTNGDQQHDDDDGIDDDDDDHDDDESDGDE